METLAAFVKCAAKLAGITEKPKMGVLVQPNPATTDLFTGITQSTLLTLLSTVKMNKKKSVVSRALGSVGQILTDVGVIALNYDMTQADMQFQGPVANILIGLMLTLLHEKAPCQVGVEAKEEEDEDEGDHDEHIPDALSELVGDLSRVLGPQFIPYFDQFFPALMKYTKPSRVHSDRCMALGCFGDVVKELGPGSIKYAEAVLPAVQNGLSDPMETVRRNAAFCVGHLVAATGKQLAPHFQHILTLLAPLCQRTSEQRNIDDGGADIDNALSAVCRMIRAAPEAVPMPQVLPVIIAALPLRADHEEGDNVYDCLIDLIKAGDATAMANFNALVAVMATTITSESKTSRETKGLVSSAIHSMAASPASSATLQSAIAAVTDAECSAALTSAANGTLVFPEE